MEKRIILAFIIIIITSVFASAQNLELDIDDNLKEVDTVCFKYKFFPGDTIIYYAVGYDSISIDYDNPILKSRFEKFRIVCDSVNKEGHYYLSQTLIEFISRESKGDIRNVGREESPWRGRTMHFAIDSLGYRKSVFPDDTLRAGVSPGGAFNPIIFNLIAEPCKKVDESWLAQDTFYLPENAYPFPLARLTYLNRASQSNDTLGYNCNVYEFINTGQGRMKIDADNLKMEMTSRINGHGKVYLDTNLFIPIHIFSTVELKMMIVDESGIKKPGWHHINLNYTLEELIPGKGRKIEEKQIMKESN